MSIRNVGMSQATSLVTQIQVPPARVRTLPPPASSLVRLTGIYFLCLLTVCDMKMPDNFGTAERWRATATPTIKRSEDAHRKAL